MTIQSAFKDLEDQMEKSELEAYKILDDIPSTIRFVAGGFIDKVKRLLEDENEKIKAELRKLERQIRIYA